MYAGMENALSNARFQPVDTIHTPLMESSIICWSFITDWLEYQIVDFAPLWVYSIVRLSWWLSPKSFTYVVDRSRYVATCHSVDGVVINLHTKGFDNYKPHMSGVRIWPIKFYHSICILIRWLSLFDTHVNSLANRPMLDCWTMPQ